MNKRQGQLSRALHEARGEVVDAQADHEQAQGTLRAAEANARRATQRLDNAKRARDSAFKALADEQQVHSRSNA
jgi:hypothetical protein